ncbi:hypothetical protein [Pelovirga terrestris]|uniref:Uncharacterized protein n=1 Tax=Pelovirga terrestris TaxID=2771352 RepID=A0A8J6UQ71_9BACT|nr:hypothetical protein [Pelovirga terrestris]MBD1401669.1 hypothetical protein [Pelovirga terrestris]
MKNKWTRLLLVGIAMVSLILGACGGGGGGGGSNESLASTSYTGERSQAYLNAENAETLVLGAYEGLNSESIVPLALETSTTTEIGIEDPYHLKTLMTRTLLLAQTDNQITMLNVFEPWEFCNNYPAGYTTDTIKETNTGLQGDINFFNCNAEDGGDVIIIDGKMTLSLVEEGNLIKVSMTMNPLYMVSGVDRYALYGKIGGTTNKNDMTSIVLTTDITMQETSGRTYWLNNYRMDSAEKYDVTGTHWGTELTISGRYYSNDHGYVDFATEEVIFMPFNDLAPAHDGLIKFTGSNGSHAYLWLGENQDDYCIKVFNDSGVVDIGTCTSENDGGDTVTEKGQLAINETHNLQIEAYATDRYSFIPSVTGTYTIAITNAQSDLSWMLSKSPNWDDEEIYFCDSSLNTSDEICTPDEVLIAGQEYYLFIDEWDNVSGTYNLFISPTQNGGDTGGENDLNFLGTTTPLSYLYFDNYGALNDGYNIDLFLTSFQVNPGGTTTWNGRGVYLEMFFPTNSVNPGTYTWSTSEAAGTFSGFSDISVFGGGSILTEYSITGGTVTISRNGPNYIINGTVTTSAGAATFSYNGPLSGNW